MIGMGNPLSKKLDETLRYYAGKYGLSSEVLDEIAAASGALTDAATALAAVASAQTAATAAGASAQAAQTTASAALSLASAAQSVANAAESAANTLAAAVADAQTAANTAQTAASTAQTAASTAQSTANTAQSAAATAQSAASAAQSTANVAQIAAAAAQTGADGAQTSANAAQTSSSTAQSTANAAQSAAAVAQTAASTAQSTANGAATAASTAQTTATAAATAASTAQTTATAAATAASTAQTTATAAATAASTAQSTANAASAAAAALTASNGGSKPLWLLPALPHADDEEFDTDGSNINLGVTLSVTATDPYAALTANTGRVEYGRRSSWMHLQVNSGFFPSVFCKKPVSIATNCLIWARMGALHRAASEERYQMAGITITGELAGQPDPLNRISCGLNDYAGNRVYVGSKFIAGGETVYPSGGGNSLTNNGAAPYPYLAIHKIGTTYHFWALSEDGARTYMGTTTFAPAVAWIGFYDSSGGTQGNPGTPIICADFLRRLDTATFPF
jgi:hypothetical protein